MFPLHNGPMRAIDHLHASVSLGRQPRYDYPMPFSVIMSCTGRRFDTYIPTHIHFKPPFRPLDLLHAGPNIQTHPTPSSKPLFLTAVRHQGFRFDPSRYSGFCSPKLFRWLVGQSYIHRLSTSGLSISSLYQSRRNPFERSKRFDRISALDLNHTASNIKRPINFPQPMNQRYEMSRHQNPIPPTPLLSPLPICKKSASNCIIHSFHHSIPWPRSYVMYRCGVGGSGMLVMQHNTTQDNTRQDKTRIDG